MYRILTPAKPHLYLNRLSFQKSRCLVYPWDTAFFYNNGREALVTGLRFLGLGKGARILLPGYICSTVSDSLKQAGFELIFLDVEPDLLLPLDQLLEIISSQEIRGVLLVDYFGFLSEENAKISLNLKKTGVLVLIDRCHSALSMSSIANDRIIADAIIYSIRKTLPVKDGGALLLASKINKRDDLHRNGWYRDLPFVLFHALERLIYILGWPNIYSNIIAKIRSLNTRGNKSVDLHYYPDTSNTRLQDLDPSYLLFNQLSHANYLADVAKIRRHNYIKLAQAVKSIGLSTLFDHLDERVVPQVLPIIVTQSGLVEFLRNQAVGAYNWPGTELATEVVESPEKYINTISHNNKIVCLPIHQSINDMHIDRMVELIRQWNPTI